MTAARARRDTSSAARVDRAGADPRRSRDVGDGRSVALRLGTCRRRGIDRCNPTRRRFRRQLGRHRADLRARSCRGGRRTRTRWLCGRRGRLRRHEMWAQERAGREHRQRPSRRLHPLGVRAESAPPGRGAARPLPDPLARLRQRNAARGVVERRLPPSSTRARSAGSACRTSTSNSSTVASGSGTSIRSSLRSRFCDRGRFARRSAGQPSTGPVSSRTRRWPPGCSRERSIGHGWRACRRMTSGWARASSASRSSPGTWRWSSGSGESRETSERAWRISRSPGLSRRKASRPRSSARDGHSRSRSGSGQPVWSCPRRF